MTIALIAALALLAHPNSFSRTHLVVDRHEVLATMECRVLSLLEVVPELDADGDGAVTERELERRRDEVFAYALAHYRLRAGTDRELRGGESLPGEPLAAALREAYIEIFTPNLLEDFREQALKQVPAGTSLPPSPELGDLDLSGLHQAAFFFA